MTNGRPHWGILGGGILGMTLAHELARRGHHVTLCEAAASVGGLASAWTLGDVVWDRHYHVTLLSDLALRGLLSELGLEQDMRWVQTRTGFFTDGNLYSMSDALDFLRFPPLGWIDKARLAATILYASRIKNWQPLEQRTVSDWLTTWSGRNTFEKMWKPLLRAKLGESYELASAAFIWTTISRLYAARRAGMKREMFGYLPGGYARMLSRFSEMLLQKGVETRLSHVAKRVERVESGRIRVQFSSGTTDEFDHVVLTMPSPVAASICQGLNERETRLLNGIQYQGIVCASVLLKKPLSDYYVTNITEPWAPFTGVIEMTALVDRSQFGGLSLVYLPKYVAPNDPLFSCSDDEIRKSFTSGLARMHPGFDAGDITSFQVSRAKYVFAIPTLQYSQNLPPVHTSVPGVHILNSAHIINGTLNVNETVQLAQKGAALLS
jgi:protoporphyrinogen oxidase